MLNKKNIEKIVGVLFFCMIFICCSTGSGLNKSFERQSITASSGNILYVGGIGPGNYTSIQDAVGNASSGDTVFVFSNASSYHENVVINKSIFLIGEDKNLVIIDAGSYDAAVTIIADDVFISGFKMICFHDNPNQFDSELIDILSVKNVTIRDNIIQQNKIYVGSDRGGVILRNSSYCFIQNNTIIKEDDTRPCWGVVLMLGSAFINISGNEINLYTGGILVRECSNNIIYMNYLHHNYEGIKTVFGNNNTIIKNIINFNDQGIRIEDGYNNIISQNTITDNGEGDDVDDGIGIIGGSENYISYNHISNNNPCGIRLITFEPSYITYNNITLNNIGVYCDHAYNNVISNNNLLFNKKNGYFEGVATILYRNIWKGNYWNRPRFMPYPIFGKGLFLPLVNFDWHPAKEPYDI